MDIGTLRSSLERADSYDRWVEALGRYFAAHDLCFGHGTDNASDEAYWLLRHVQRWREDVWDRPPDPSLAAAVAKLAERRVTERMPLAYLLGEAWFAGLPFKVNRDVLIPRSPIAELIERCFAPWVELAPGDSVLDVGTGSGCLAVATAYRCPQVRVDATDVSGAALTVAAANVARHGLVDRVRLLAADLFPSLEKPYRVIMSNPPYVSDDEYAGLPPEYGHEPKAALVGGPTGIEPAERLLEGARAYLTGDGILIVEVGNAADALMAAHPRLEAVWLEFERGGEGVFLITADELRRSGF